MSAWLSESSSVGVILAGVIMIVLGLVALAFGVAGGIAKMIKELRETPSASSLEDPIAALERLVAALTKFLSVLVKSPVWLTLVVIGLVLVAFGATLIGQG